LVSDLHMPEEVAPTPENVGAAIIAYAAGDALGVPWEGRTPDGVVWEMLEELPARGDWPRGSTSDDTDQLILVLLYLVEAKGRVDEREFLGRLAKAIPTMRGAGPTTQAAVQRFRATGELEASGGSSIGAAMRALPFGWAIPVAAGAARRELTMRLSRTTHGAPVAIMSACAVAEMAAWAIEQHPIDLVLAAGLREAEYLVRLYGLHPATLQPLRQAASGDWISPVAEEPTNAMTTLAGVLHVLQQRTDLATGMKRAVGLGGDTDTAAAIVGGILGSQVQDVESHVPWLPRVVLPELELIERMATELHDLRRSWYA
jgi:ADP-ribosyl-[dinitrogen reductase] hydrolase